MLRLDAASSASPIPENGYFGTTFGAAYTSGYFGNVIVKQLAFDGNVHGFYCNNSTFGGCDPVPGQTKFCYVGNAIIY